MAKHVDMFVQHMKHEIAGQVIKTGNALMSDEEVRQMAVRFFQQQMAAYLAEHLTH